MTKSYRRFARRVLAGNYIKKARIEYVAKKEITKLSGVSHGKLAVVVHLYYPEVWPIIREKLGRIDDYEYDIYVSLPRHQEHYRSRIIADYKNAKITILPNHGRDVYPFVLLLPYLELMKYEYVLKLHSKKSPHRKDGRDWFENMLNNLLPSNKKTLRQLFAKLEDANTGVIGPAGQYLPLSVNFEANGAHMTKVLNKIYDKRTSYNILQTDRKKYGFFAGTMFWARLDAIDPIINQHFKAKNFEPEAGQIDATLAHALERLLSVLPEIRNKYMYEVSSNAIKQISYSSENIPDWSDVYIGPK